MNAPKTTAEAIYQIAEMGGAMFRLEQLIERGYVVEIGNNAKGYRRWTIIVKDGLSGAVFRGHELASTITEACILFEGISPGDALPIGN